MSKLLWERFQLRDKKLIIRPEISRRISIVRSTFPTMSLLGCKLSNAKESGVMALDSCNSKCGSFQGLGNHASNSTVITETPSPTCFGIAGCRITFLSMDLKQLVTGLRYKRAVVEEISDVPALPQHCLQGLTLNDTGI